MPVTAAAGPWPDTLIGTRPAGRPSDCRLLLADMAYGRLEAVDLPADRWHGPVSPAEAAVLARAASPVLDVGCGPGRHVQALAAQGREALGIDVSDAAVAATRSRGAQALRASVFSAVPCAGQWGTVLLLDGNIGIGGDPALLLIRVRELLRPGGSALVELEPPEVPARRFQARVHHGGRTGPVFPWARLGAAAVAGVAATAGLGTVEVWESDRRWFAELEAPTQPEREL